MVSDNASNQMTGVNFANLLMGDLNLLIPQTDIYTLEPTLDVRFIKTDDIGVVGEFERNGTVWALYALSQDLMLLPNCPETYRIAVLFKNTTIACGLLCEQIQNISYNQVIVHSVPRIMYSTQFPICALARYGDEVRCITQARLLSELFHSANRHLS